MAVKSGNANLGYQTLSGLADIARRCVCLRVTLSKESRRQHALWTCPPSTGFHKISTPRRPPPMQFGISYPTYIRAWRDVQMAEEYGFSHAWFDDSHMCYSDVFATMALAAEHSRSAVLGTFVLCAGNRAAPVSASALATINEIAPGREIGRASCRER